MKMIKRLKGWGIYQNSKAEQEEYEFKITVIQPCLMEYSNTPRDSDMEFEDIESAISWVKNYEKNMKV